ncbi:hypothetical protein PybrP1_012634 [[Pythium] brassicae (nom. inval.)]|nr:hypothetical protein PybrP1_012634 [[Pythium] brassicae (nom. inval.)]
MSSPRPPRPLLLVALLLLAALAARVHAEPQFAFEGESHRAFGRALGSRFAPQIRERVQRSAKLHALLLPFHATPDGQKLYAQYLDTHTTVFPDYVDELRGIAEGSAVPFETIFLLNLVEEFEDSIPATFKPEAPAAARRHTLRCSDIVLTGPRTRVVAHNEDSGAEDVNHTAIVTAKIGGNPKFVAYTYLGDLPSGAFGFNANGVAFTLNFVQPAQTFVGGIGRGFVSRDLLHAANASDAAARITRPKQATGHNFQLMDVAAQRVWNVEVASFERHAVHEYVVNRTDAGVAAYFHANQYQRLDIEQPPYASSLHRLQRYSELVPPTTVREALAVLGDQHDQSYPVFHDALSHERGELSGWTLTTVVFDLLEGRAYSYRGNPKRMSVKFIWNLKTLRVTPDEAE